MIGCRPNLATANGHAMAVAGAESRQEAAVGLSRYAVIFIRVAFLPIFMPGDAVDGG